MEVLLIREHPLRFALTSAEQSELCALLCAHAQRAWDAADWVYATDRSPKIFSGYEIWGVDPLQRPGATVVLTPGYATISGGRRDPLRLRVPGAFELVDAACKRALKPGR